MTNSHMKIQVICNDPNKFQPIHLREAERQVHKSCSWKFYQRRKTLGTGAIRRIRAGESIIPLLETIISNTEIYKEYLENDI